MKHLLFPLADMQVSLWLLVARRRGCDRAAILRSAKESERGHWGYSWPYRLVGSACLCYEKFIVHFTNMVESIKQKLYYSLYTVAAFVITRYPYVCAVLLMLSTGEEFNTGVRKVNSGRFSMIYAHLGMYFLAGTAMSFDLFGTKRLFALISATQMGLSSYQDYVTSGLKESVMVSL